MNKNITTTYNIKRFADQCFYKATEKAARIIKSILDVIFSKDS